MAEYVSCFDFPDARLTCNFGINRQGDIVGLYVDQTGVRHGFLARRGAEGTGSTQSQLPPHSRLEIEGNPSADSN